MWIEAGGHGVEHLPVALDRWHPGGDRFVQVIFTGIDGHRGAGFFAGQSISAGAVDAPNLLRRFGFFRHGFETGPVMAHP